MTKTVFYDSLPVGGGNTISVQSMINTKLQNYNESLKQIQALIKNGCDIVRVAVTNESDAIILKKFKKAVSIPIIADIQFDYRIAIESIKNDASGIRINPGNISSDNKVKEIVYACKEKNIPIRVGVNSGSVKKEFLAKYNGVNKNSLVESALEQVKLIEKFKYYNIVVSIKSSDVNLTYESNKELTTRIDYPLHLGITESGFGEDGIIKSSIGLGSMLINGIGDTIRVSLTDNPVQEVIIGRKILQYLNLRNYGIEFISCPTCGRTNIDLINISRKVKEKLKESNIKKNIKVAIMGCAVNGPGEAREADIGIAGGKGNAVLFKKGQIFKKIKEESIIDELIKEIKKI